MKLTINTDGGARGNPGPASSSFIIKDEEGRIIKQQAFYIGETTNNVAEYTAVVKALDYLIENINPTETDLQFFLDSNLVVQQLNGNFKLKQEHLKPLFAQIVENKHKFKSANFAYIPREQNSAADALVNTCLNERSL